MQIYALRTSDLILRIPAASAQVGDLEVYDEGELTAVVGKIWHEHFGDAAEAVAWIKAVIADQVRFRVEQKQGKVIRASSWEPSLMDGGALDKETDTFHEYTWSKRLV